MSSLADHDYISDGIGAIKEDAWVYTLHDDLVSTRGQLSKCFGELQQSVEIIKFWHWLYK